MPTSSTLLSTPSRGRVRGHRGRHLLVAAALTACIACSPQLEEGQTRLPHHQASRSDTSQLQHGPAGRSYLRDYESDAVRLENGPAGRSYLRAYEPVK